MFQLFRPLGIVVVLSHLEVWQAENKVMVLEAHNETLHNLKPYRKKLLEEKPHIPNDNTILLTWVVTFLREGSS